VQLENNSMMAGDTTSVMVEYTTKEGAQALSWMKPSQTSGGELPYMYTQCEDINCRSIVPVQDTPSNKVTYSARVQHMDTVVSYMSANITQEATPITGTSDVETYFKCDIPIPNYLMAIAVGHLEKTKVGRNTYVITEPEDMAKCVAGLEDMQLYLDTVEAYLTPYIWGDYAILVLPPSFPMGGMENPLLTFASPTIIDENKSQAYVAIHEMAHSWTGNTVTCRDWENFWLNEGFTVWVERAVS
jgi:leukotriene-A4 hydrolase